MDIRRKNTEEHGNPQGTLRQFLATIGMEAHAPEAEYYLLRPVGLHELESGLPELPRQPEPASPDELVGVAGACWKYDPVLWTLTAPNGRSLQLSLSESRLMSCLMARAGEATTREELLVALDRPKLESHYRNLDVTISRLRKKLEDGCEQKLPVTSARGHGYVFNAPGEIIRYSGTRK